MKYACHKCKRTITDWRATVRPDGRLELAAHCHGDVSTRVIPLDMQGVLFYDGPVLDLPTRDPDEFVRLAREGEGKGAA